MQFANPQWHRPTLPIASLSVGGWRFQLREKINRPLFLAPDGDGDGSRVSLLPVLNSRPVIASMSAVDLSHCCPCSLLVSSVYSVSIHHCQ